MTQLIVSGNVITDLVRSRGQYGDFTRRPGTSSGGPAPYPIGNGLSYFYIGPTYKNLLANGGVESNLNLWTAINGATRSQQTTDYNLALFGVASGKVVQSGANGGVQIGGNLAVSNGNTVAARISVVGPNNMPFTLRLTDGVTNFDGTATTTGTSGLGGQLPTWKLAKVRAVLNSAGPWVLYAFSSHTADTFYLDGAQYEISEWSNPYAHTDGAANGFDAGRITLPANVLDSLNGGVAFTITPQWNNTWRAQNAVLFSWLVGNGGSSGSIQVQYNVGLDRFELVVTDSTLTTITAAKAATFSDGDNINIVVYWDINKIYLIVNGATAVTANRPFPAVGPSTIGMLSVADIGSLSGLSAYYGQTPPYEAGCNFHWFTSWVGVTPASLITFLNAQTTTDPDLTTLQGLAGITSYTGFNNLELWVPDALSHVGRGGRKLGPAPLRDIAPWEQVVEPVPPYLGSSILSGAVLVGDSIIECSFTISDTSQYGTGITTGATHIDLIIDNGTRYYISDAGLLLIDNFNVTANRHGTLYNAESGPAQQAQGINPYDTGQYLECLVGAAGSAVYQIDGSNKRIKIGTQNFPARLQLFSIGFETAGGQISLPYYALTFIDQINGFSTYEPVYQGRIAFDVTLPASGQVGITVYDDLGGSGTGYNAWQILLTQGSPGSVSLSHIVAGSVVALVNPISYTSIGSASTGRMDLRVNGNVIELWFAGAKVFTYVMSLSESTIPTTYQATNLLVGACTIMINTLSTYISNLVANAGRRE